MKSVLFTLQFLVWTVIASAQLTITPGSQLSFSGNAQLILNNTDLVNNGSIQAGTGTISFTGSGNAAISGSQPIQFYGLEINKSAGSSVLLQRPIGIDGQVNFSSGFLDLNGYDADLGSTGSLNKESGTGRIIGSNGGEVIFNTTLNAPSSVNPGNLGIIISSAQNLGNTIVKRGHQVQAISSQHSILRYYEIIPANNTGLDATLRFNYFGEELNGQDESSLVFWKKTAPEDWTSLGFDSRNTTQLNYVEKAAISSLGRFTLSPGPGALPIQFILFNVQCNGNSVLLRWETAQEQNSHYFTVEKNTDASGWKSFGNIPAAGNSSNVRDYSFVDSATTGNAYYRIAEHDLNGGVQYTKILSVDCNGPDVFRTWPNPVHDLLTINISVSNSSPVIIKIIDGKGSVVRQQTATLLNGNNLLMVNMAALASAPYFLVITYNKQTRTERIIKR